jgi:type I restriction enzyme S subunit
MSAKARWTRVAFGDVVRQVKDRVDPEESGLERYVAGEHMDTDDLRIRRWGTIGNGYLGPAFHMRFKPGHVLYGSRRTYLRKVAVADFVGITANTTFVLESKAPRVLLPELLPFVMQTETFHEHAIKQSKGSVNPYINFSDLTCFEFPLPPREVQRGLVSVLQAAARQREVVRNIEPSAHTVERAEIQHRFQAKSQWPALPMHRVGDVQLGQQMHPKYTTGAAPRPYLRVPNITDGYLDLSKITAMDFVGNAYDKHRLQPGDLLLTEGDLTGPRNVGRVAMFRGEIEDCCVQKTLLRFRPGPMIRPEYALWACRHLRYAGVFAEASTGTTVAHLVAEKFKEVMMPIAPQSVQEEIADSVERWFKARALIRERIEAAERLYHVQVSALLVA